MLVDSEAYLLELARYVVLNPVRAGMTDQPGAWPWSSYNAAVGSVEAPEWLAIEALMSPFSEQRLSAQGQFANFVFDGIGKRSVWEDLKSQIFLGDEDFVRRAQARLGAAAKDVNIPLPQRRPPPTSLAAIEQLSGCRNDAIVAAYESGGYSYQALADYFGLHFTTVGRLVRSAREKS